MFKKYFQNFTASLPLILTCLLAHNAVAEPARWEIIHPPTSSDVLAFVTGYHDAKYYLYMSYVPSHGAQALQAYVYSNGTDLGCAELSKGAPINLVFFYDNKGNHPYATNVWGHCYSSDVIIFPFQTMVFFTNWSGSEGELAIEKDNYAGIVFSMEGSKEALSELLRKTNNFSN